MCNRVDNAGLSLQEVSDALMAEIAEGNYYTASEVNAFDRPAIPIVLDHLGRKITHGTWGISKEAVPGKPAQGINLRAENSDTYWKQFRENRCIVPVTGFYDWMSVTRENRKTPVKIKHRMNWKNMPQFYIGAYYDVWDNKEVGFGILTTQSNELMSVVHNSKMRMPICMDARHADLFLNGEALERFTFPAYDPQLVAVNLEPEKMPINQPKLFD